MGKSINWVLLLFLIIFSLRSYSQSVYMYGKVIIEQSKLPLPNANIFLLNKQDQTLVATTTDTLGLFRIQKRYFANASRLKITYLNVEEFYPLNQENIVSSKENDLSVFKYKLTIHELKEINIKSKRRYHDTTKIDLSHEKFERYVMIEDLFRKSYGFTKDEGGQLYYNGKIVSNLTVNGKKFFELNTRDLYKMLPALIISNIQVVETNVDSLTNTTTLEPTIKVNLQLKDKYGSGKFGNLTIGAGSSERYITNFDLYGYGLKDQLSLKFNSDNINKNSTPDPSLDFGTNSSIQTTTSSQLNFNKTLNNLEISFLINGKIENSNSLISTIRNDQIINQTSNFFTSSHLRLFTLDNSNLNIKLKIDPLSSLTLNETLAYNDNKQSDSSSYSIITGSIKSLSKLNRTTNTLNSSFINKAIYQRNFQNLPGRTFNLELNREINSYKVEENDLDKSTEIPYSQTSNRTATENIYKVISSYNEPISESAYFKVISSFTSNFNNYTISLNGDTIKNNRESINKISNKYFDGGLIFHKTFNNLSLDQSLNETIYYREILLQQQISNTNFNFLLFDFKLDYKINKDKSLYFNLNSNINYPNITQITSINNSTYDPLFTQTSNIFLKPEIDRGMSINFNQNKNSVRFTYFAKVDFYESKIGINIKTLNNGGQTSYFDNVGSSLSGLIGFTIFKQTNNENYFSSTTNLAYSETPLIENLNKLLNSAMLLNQTFTAKVSTFNKNLTSSPILSLSVGKYGYGSGSSSQFNLTYIDKQSFTIKQFTISTYGLLNINRTINTSKTFGINAEVKKSILKNYGFIWLKGYNIFNTYKALDYSNGPTYIQSSNYLNLNRYIIFGLSMNFNNMR